MVAAGDRAVALFVVHRMDCEAFAPAPDCDPAFAAALVRVADAGVEVLVYACALATERIAIARRIDWRR